MAYELTQRTINALSSELIEPNIVLTIDGINTKFAVKINKIALTYDLPGLTYDSGLSYDGLAGDPDTLDLISLSGTSTSISMQLEPDKGAASSTQNITISLIDRNNIVSEIISPGVVVDDVIYRNCRLYLGMFDTAFPEDYIEIFNGKVMGINPGVGIIDLQVTHPEDLKKSSIFEKAETTLVQAALFDSAEIQDLTYTKRADVVGSVSIEYTTAAIGDTANITVTGNDISAQIDPSFTSAKTLKKKIENDEDANQLVTVKLTGDANTVQTGQAQTFLTSSTEIFVDSVKGFLPDSGTGLFETFLRINDEIIKYTAIDTVANKFTGITRASIGSFGASHADGDNVSSFYQLGDGSDLYGNAVDTALRLMLSAGEANYFSGSATHFVSIPGVGSVSNSIFLPGVYLKRDYGTVNLDLCTVSGSTSNDFVGNTITSITEINTGTYITVSGTTLVTELNSSATLTCSSQYNVLPDGLGMLPRQIDIDRFNFIKSTYSTALANYAFYLKDSVNSKEFLNTQVLLPSALYSMPRKGRISCGIISPPLYDENTKVLGLDNVKNPKGIKINRSVSKNFYNTVIYQYNPDSVEDKFLNKNISISADSKNRIDAPSKVFQMKADGMRPGGTTADIINRNASRFLDRYKFGAEGLKVDVLFKTGFGVEIGDAIIFGDPSFNLTDTTNGTKEFAPRIMEVVNKDLNWKTGSISLALLDSNYSANLRFGVFSPSSIIGSGSTTTNIILSVSYGTVAPSKEKDKWQNYIGKEITVHSEDWSVQGNTYIQGFSGGDDSLMQVSPALSFSPTAGYIIDIPQYTDIDTLESFYKNVHVFWDPQVLVVSGSSATSFDVGGGDIGKFFINCIIRVHNYDFTIDSGETGKKVTNISGNTITCEDLGFTPASGQFVELIGFSSDEGKPYSWL